MISVNTYVAIVVTIAYAEAAEFIVVTVAIANDIQIAHGRKRRCREGRRRDGRCHRSRDGSRDGSGHRCRRRNKDAHGGGRHAGILRHVVGIVAVVAVGHGQAVASWNGFVGGALEAYKAGGAFCKVI